jgi:hypothetical protein
MKREKKRTIEGLLEGSGDGFVVVLIRLDE